MLHDECNVFNSRFNLYFAGGLHLKPKQILEVYLEKLYASNPQRQYNENSGAVLSVSSMLPLGFLYEMRK